MRESILSLIYRLVGVASKFLLIFILAKVLSEKDFVAYGVISSFILYLQYAVGFDIYTFANREYVLLKSKIFKFRLISKQYSIYFLIYVLIVLPVTLFFSIFLDPVLVILFGILLVTEHLFTEVCRFWIFNSSPVYSSYIYFIKSILILILPLSYFLIFDYLSVTIVILFWIISNFISLALSMLKFNLFKIILRFYQIDLPWLKIALSFSFPLMISALSSRAAFTFDRSVAGYFLDFSQAAAYILIISFFGVMNLIIDTAFFNFKSPFLIISVRDNCFSDSFSLFLRQGFLVIVGLTLMFLPIGILAIYFFHEKLTTNNLESFGYLSIAFFVYSISQLYHFALYAHGLGKDIFIANLISFISMLFLFLSLYIFNGFSVNSLVLSILVFSIVMLVSKYLFYSMFSERNNEILK